MGKTYTEYNPLGDQTVLLRCHDEIVSLVLVVDDVLEVDPGGGVEVLEELLVEDERHAADLLHAGLGLRVPIDEVGGDGDRQLPAELLPRETLPNKNTWK